MVDKPDVYVCGGCENRFQKATLVTEEIDGIYQTIPSCPSCGSTDIVTSAMTGQVSVD